ncbi:hypothetical protein PIB30_074561 [Stylosanthes scabra]|uniref:Aminotransferase-like plant mobile domain-containing protein n=1 Tax=Stylosanthes scabra TaxID=79078 RepID=A0ABU6WSH2_9FABA|nr:hypothetical protein [Stylosanthes scabra]
MHVHDGHFGRGEWYPTFFKGWYDMWNDQEEAQVPIFPSADLRPSHQYLCWYFSWARLVLAGHGDHVPHAAGVFPPELPPGQTPDAPELRQPEDGDLPALNAMSSFVGYYLQPDVIRCPFDRIRFYHCAFIVVHIAPLP